MARRSDNLREAITAYIDEARKIGFVWGFNDCALYANNMLVKVFGAPDWGKDFRGKYNDYRSALKVARQLGYKFIPDIPAKHLFKVERPRTGDVALYPDGRTLGVCLGVNSYFIGSDHLIAMPNKKLKQFWRYEA